MHFTTSLIHPPLWQCLIVTIITNPTWRQVCAPTCGSENNAMSTEAISGEQLITYYVL